MRGEEEWEQKFLVFVGPVYLQLHREKVRGRQQGSVPSLASKHVHYHTYIHTYIHTYVRTYIHTYIDSLTHAHTHATMVVSKLHTHETLNGQTAIFHILHWFMKAES